MKVLGIMSGTSLDGLDLAIVDFKMDNGKLSYSFGKCSTVKYSEEWEERLKVSRTLSGVALTQLNTDYGRYLGEKVNEFLAGEPIDLISSHGHTVFHQPEKGFTLQIGSLNEIATVTGIKTVGDFRTLDVSKGGQGAPLVPIGDKMLFGEYEYCINLGGISNFSFESGDNRQAKDLSPCNIVSNHFARQLGLSYDESGNIGKKGKVHPFLLQRLNNWSYYSSDISSLGIERIEEDFLPLFEEVHLSIEDKLKTYYEHLGIVIGSKLKTGKALFTGGGVKNDALIEAIKRYSKSKVIIPDDLMIDFKEALIFALLGYLRINEQVNILSSVTGASSDSSSGIIVAGN